MPQIRIRDAGGLVRTVARIRMRDEAGNLRTIQRIRARDGSGILRTVFQYMQVTLSAYEYTKQLNSPPPHTSSAAITATPTGGMAPYTYAWSSVFPNSTSVVSPTSATTHFNGAVANGNTINPAWVCTVTDATGAVSDSPAVNVIVNGV